MKNYYPIDILPVYASVPLVELEGLDIIISAEDEEINDIAKKIREIFYQHNIYVKVLRVSAQNMDKRCIFLVYEKTEDEKIIKNIKTKILMINKVESVSEACRYKNLVYSCKQYPLTFLSKRIILLGPANLRALVIDSRKILGPKIASLLLYNIGKAVGIEVHKIYTDIVENITKLSEAIEFMKFLLGTTGWGILTGYTIERDNIVLSLEDLWECNILLENRMKEEAEYTKGVFSGFFEELFKKDVIVKQLIMKKNKETTYCVFEIKR